MSNFKYVENVFDYLKQIIDEPDSTFVDDAMLQSFLEIAHNEYVQIVSDIDPNFFMTSKNYILSNVKELDLATVAAPIMGATVAAPEQRVYQILRIVLLDGSGNPTSILSQVYSYESLVTPGFINPGRFMLQGTLLKFSGTVNSTIRIEYVPVPSVDWTQTTAGDNQWIDELVMYHDLIALLAAKQYFQMDNAENTATLRQIANRTSSINDYVERGRLRNANRFVQEENPWNYGV